MRVLLLWGGRFALGARFGIWGRLGILGVAPRDDSHDYRRVGVESDWGNSRDLGRRSASEAGVT